ncbi:MAG: hypothetical protein AAB912_02825, partial [Patescibacteria group bacterium]
MNIINTTRLAIVGASVAAMIAMPTIAGAAVGVGGPAKNEGNPEGNRQIEAQDLGLYYGEAIGLGTRSLQETIASIIRVVLSLLGIVALVIVLMGGFKWMTAGGSDEKVKEAKKTIFQGIIGLAIVLS